MLNLTSAQLRNAADLQEKIAKLQTQLAALVGTETKASPSAKPIKKKRNMSAAAKAKISAAAKKQWDRVKAAGKTKL